MQMLVDVKGGNNIAEFSSLRHVRVEAEPEPNLSAT